MTKITLVLGIVFWCNSVFGQPCKCDSLFIETQKIVENNYAGWFDKVNSTNLNTYKNWTKTYYELSAKTTSDSICFATLQQWITFFKDSHLKLKFNKPRYPSKQTIQVNKTIEILTSALTEKQIENYLANQKNLDPIEGIYISSSYTLGITKINEHLFYATILTTTNSNWKAGEVKLTIEKNNNTYKGTFYQGDKTDTSQHLVKLVDNILDFDIIFFEKISPNVTTKRDIKEYEMSKDKYAPSITFKGNDMAVFTFPSFQNNSYEQLEYLLKKYEKQLETIPYWTIDLSNNSGGDYEVGMQLLKYFYTKPIIEYKAEMRMTPQNFDTWFNAYIKDIYENLDTKNKKKYDDYFDSMKANYGKFFNTSGKAIDTITLEKTLPFPKKIGILINKNTVSSGELFTIIARQSDKVIVFGENSGGMMDYGNIVQYKTTCTALKVQLPINRQLWLNTGFSVDKEGIKPTIYLTGENWLTQVYQALKKE